MGRQVLINKVYSAQYSTVEPSRPDSENDLLIVRARTQSVGGEDYEVVHAQQHSKIAEIEACKAKLLKLNKRAKKQQLKEDKLMKQTERDNVVLTDDNSKCIQVTEEVRK